VWVDVLYEGRSDGTEMGASWHMWIRMQPWAAINTIDVDRGTCS